MSVHRDAFTTYLVLGFLLLIPWAAGAQSTTTGTIAGTVKDTTGAVLPGVTVEASSPALIEKTRSAVSDGQGNYRILELRPGTYAVTFTLPGFSTVKREGLELATGFTANVTVELRVGAVEETVTVTGASPVVDVQNVRQQTVMTREMYEAIPSGKTLASYVQLTLGATMGVSGIDVGGTKGDKAGGGSFEYHGAGRNDSNIVIDGMSVNPQTTGGGPWTRTTVNNQQAMEEQTIGSGISAEQENAGLLINLIPRDGGNVFTGNFALNGSHARLQGDNLTQELKDRGTAAVGEVAKLYDAGGGGGGPIRRNRVWFYASDRWWNAANVVPGAYYNATPKPVYGFFPVYTPDVSRPGVVNAPNHNSNLRMTWQAANAHKLAFYMEIKSACQCFFGTSAANAPEASMRMNVPYGTSDIVQGNWTYVKGNRWLFSAGNTSLLSVQSRVRYGSVNQLNAVSTRDIALLDLNTGMRWNNRQDDPNAFGGVCCTPIPDGKIKGRSYTADQKYSATYSTGSHTFKMGGRTYEFGSKGSGSSSYNDTPLGPVLVRVRGGVCLDAGCTPPPIVPASIVLLINPQGPAQEGVNQGGSAKFVTALYAQEQWTLKRLTLNLGVRYDSMNGMYKKYTSAANNYAPSFDFPEVKNSPNWKDIAPRLGAAYDLFGNGKTAVKGSWGRFIVHQTDAGSSPSNLLGFSGGVRTWNDSFYPVGDPRRGNFFPDCSLTNPLTNGECGPVPNANRGLPTAPSTFYDSAFLEGWGVRPYLWQSSLSVQQEVLPGVAVNVGYTRTVNKNATVSDNRAIAASDYDRYCVTAPTDARLGSVSGSQLCGLTDLKLAKVGQVNTLVTIPSTLGLDPVNQYDGLDISLNARFGKGGVVSGGVSTAKTVDDGCYTIDKPFRDGYCRSVTGWAAGTQVKFFGAYPLPWWGVMVSGTFLNLGGPEIGATQTYTSAQIRSSLGRDLSAGSTATTSVSLLPPNSLYEPRVSTTDIRVTKSIRLQRLRTQLQFDVYNLFNSSAVLAASSTYGTTWQRPSSILGARLIKFGMQMDWR